MASDSDAATHEKQAHRPQGKLSRLIVEYEFYGLGEELEKRWLGDSTKRYSLRKLAEYVNNQLLREAMQNAGMDPLDGEVENVYRLLTDDSVNTGARTQAYRRLQRAGVDVKQLETDFVSRQAVHTYLTKNREISYTIDETDPIIRETSNIRKLRQQMKTIIEGKVTQLRDADHLTLGEFELFLNVQVLCEDCGTQYQISELLDTRSCDCSSLS